MKFTSNLSELDLILLKEYEKANEHYDEFLRFKIESPEIQRL